MSCCTPGRGSKSRKTGPRHESTCEARAVDTDEPAAGDETADGVAGRGQTASGGSTAGGAVAAAALTFVDIEGGWFTMGTDSDEGFPEDGEGPERRVWVDPFAISPFAVTNAQFQAFVDATGYKTEAERFGWSFVFHLFVSKQSVKRAEVRRVPGLDWWVGVARACWKRPEGRGSNLRGREEHPVVHVSWNDAAAYCEWSGTRLPREAEWECAARAGTEGQNFPWGNELQEGGSYHCNTWQGSFPETNTEADGYAGTCPVDAFEPNRFGLYNVCGNVWEWCQDWFSPSFHREERDETRVNPAGPPSGQARVTRGGSYLCHHSYCNRYRLPARSSNTPDSSTGNTGFRVVVRG